MKLILIVCIMFIIAILVHITVDTDRIGKIEAKQQEMQKELNQILDQINKANTEVIGKASWYDYNLPGMTDYSKRTLTAASRDLPRGSKAQVCRQNKCITVRINDWVKNSNVIIDLSSYAFQQLAPLLQGIIEVEVRKIN